MRVLPGLLLLLLALTACGEPDVDVSIPERDGHVLDLAGILQTDDLETRLEALRERGLDVVALTYETPQANCGEAFRAGLELVTDWSADVAVVAVARPGDFASTSDDRERCLGLRPLDDFDVGRGLREEIAEQLVPPIAADNQWDQAFDVAITRLADELTEGGS